MNSSETTMLPQASFIDIPVAQNVQQMLAFEDKSFVYCAYRTLLKRDPDDVGMTYYLGRLRGGENKMQVLKELHASAEGRRVGATVAGLEAAIRRFKIARMFGIGRAPAVKQQLQSQGVVIDATTAEVVTTHAAPAPVAANAVRVIRAPANDHPQNSEVKHDSNGMPIRTIWVDLTTSMEWTEGVVGIIRAELEIACGLNRVHENVRFSMQIENGFVEIQKDQLQWLLDSENVADAYMNFFKRYKKTDTNALAGPLSSINEITVNLPNSSSLYFPFKANDIVISVGWMDSKKEVFFSKVKQKCRDIIIGYLVYDIILLLKQTRHFYHVLGQEKFKNYVRWISCNADFIIYGGNTAKKDTEALQLAEHWPTPPGVAVKFGTDIMKSVDPEQEDFILKELGVTGPFIITVGSIEPRKNHDTVYKAYLLAQELNPTGLPQLFICGRPMWRVDDIVDTIDRDPRLAGKVIRLSPTDTQLAALYKHCSFTLLPSLYEGWSLTLPESLGQGKFCLCADTPPLREIGGDLVDYAPPWDVKTWAQKIAMYSFEPEKLRAYEQRIAREWPQTRWSDTSKMIFDNAVKFADLKKNTRLTTKVWNASTAGARPTIWMDITLSFLDWQGNVNGIIRSELNYARYLKQIAPEIRFFAYTEDYFFEVEENYLLWLFEDSDLSSAYAMFQSYWKSHEEAGTGYRNPFRVTGGPVIGHSAYLNEFPENTVALFVGIDFIEGRTHSRIIDIVQLASDSRGVMTSQLIYDFTPILYPQFHVKETCSGYIPFIKHVSEKFGHLLYGGRTAQRDGIQIQRENGWGTPPSDFLEFGSNLGKLDQSYSAEADREMLQRLGVEGTFIMTVGTIEPRKNHELLYKAYVTLLEQGNEAQLPKMLFIGKKGWKSDDFLASFESDDRVKGKILMLTPTDEELDALYRHCLFTLLPSFYEGWSLTLPESLSYGKFCLTSDVDPLKETGRDLVEYINPLDTYAWADRIRYYATHPAELAAKEAYIKQHWKPKTWRESTVMLRDALYAAHKARYTQEPQAAQDIPVKPADRKAVATAK
jgi:glycosyltransferase involved in cell wall biosynthesis